MGRGSRTEQSDAPDFQTNNNVSSNYQNSTDTSQASPRVVAESESIARDIKEGRLSGFVGHGTVLTGETNFQMMLRVDGHLTGTVSSEGGTLIVGTNGQVDANITVAVAQVNGEVNGDISATEKIHLGRTARVVGNVATPRLIIEEGAVFEGGCNMMKARENQEKLAAASQEQYRSSQMSSVTETEETDDTDEFLGTATEEEEESAEAAVI
ncbi:MAG: polymer-forming cytoskeletal protein [Acidobacteriota bacterium]